MAVKVWNTAMMRLTVARLTKINIMLMTAEVVPELYGSCFRPDGINQDRLDTLTENFHNELKGLKEVWLKWPDVVEAIAPRINGSPDAWFVQLCGLRQQLDTVSFSHAVRNRGYRRNEDPELRRILHELSMYEHTVSIAIARLSPEISDTLVDVKTVAQMVILAETTVREYSQEWGPPERKGKGRAPHLWKWSVIRPKLIEQCGGVKIPPSPPSPARKKTARSRR